MLHDQLLLQWLRAHTGRDRVIANALNAGTVESIEQTSSGWRVSLRSRRGVEYRLVVVAHVVTGEPVRWYREARDEG